MSTPQIKQLSYLHCFIQEVMRLRPPTPATSRQASQNCTVDGVFIPKGTSIYIPNRSVNMDKKVWGEDADEFKPERWENLPKDYDSTFSMMTFIAGPHHCIGRNMSIMVSVADYE
jgi:cytochrome P450